MRIKKSILKVGIAVLMMGGITAQAVDRTWTGGGIGTSWNESSNWSPAGIPVPPSDTAVFDATSTIKLDPIDLGGITDLSDLQLTAPAGNVGFSYTVNLNLGDIDMSSATKDLNFAGTSAMHFGRSTDTAVTVDVASGRTITITGLAQALVNDKTVDFIGAGTVNLAAGAFDLGRETDDTGETTVNLSDGTLSIPASELRMWYGENTFNQTGGIIEMLDVLHMAIGAVDDHNNTYILAGGTVKARRVRRAASVGSGTTAFVFDGGTFEVVAGGAGAEFSSNLDEVRIDAGGATIDTAGQTLSMYKEITGSGIGTLTKNGVGDLWLNETNNYGDTVVNGGRLLANEPGALGFDQARTITVNAGARIVFTAVASHHDLLDVIVDSAGGGFIEVSAGPTNSINRLSLDGGVSQMPAGIYGDETTGFIGDGYIEVTDLDSSSIIYSLTSISNDIMKVEFKTLTSPSFNYLRTKTDLVIDPSWTNAAISDDGINPFVVTNLGYSTAVGTTNVVYVQYPEDERFFGIGQD